ncbi:MAG TPA: ferritin-like protein [Solirubrobacteraceae bacterium]|jgi:rubrerythrin|nr:ferritin-like protein [Solirubrobacteraceae bacterium]
MLLIKAELAQNLDTPEGVQLALQTAIELEHSTIPPYLYALYSLTPGSNAEIAELVGSVVAEEMAHMALACNILNAVLGEPVIDKPGFLPLYPGPLPGTVEEGLSVGLEPFSLELLSLTFMVIEQPEDRPPVLSAAAAKEPLTIGRFYEMIREALEALGGDIFTGKPGYQVHGGIALPEVKAVERLEDAVLAIHTIVEQGEGTSTDPFGDEAHDELAHYFRFAEIVKGRKYVQVELQTPCQKVCWAYEGEAIPFDASKVYPVVANPKAQLYPEGSAARHACDTFNYTYTSLLNALHETFNGKPTVLNTAVGLMESLNEQAQEMMKMKLESGLHVGPSFEYRPTNP